MKSTKKNQIIFFFPLFELGGVEKNFFIVSNYIAVKLKYLDFYLITYEKTNFLKKNINKNIKIIFSNFKISFLPRRIKFIYCMYKLFINCVNNPKASIFSFQGNFYALIIAIILKRKIIIRSNISPEGWANNYFKKKLFKYLLSKSNLIIVNGNEFNKKFKKFFSLKPVTIHNPIIKEKENKQFKKNFFNENTINLLNIGRLVKQKNQSEIIEALATIRNKEKFRLLIIGQGPEKKKLINLIKEKKLKNLVKISHNQKTKNYYLRKSNIFILSSLYEGFPNVLLEAALNKKYIISSDCPTGPKELIKSYKYGKLYKKNSVIHLSKVLQKIINDHKILLKDKKMISFKSVIFNYKYNLEKYKKELLNIINSTQP